jgi:hypothetical protein
LGPAPPANQTAILALRNQYELRLQALQPLVDEFRQFLVAEADEDVWQDRSLLRADMPET